MSAILITTQVFLDAATVAAKRAAGDYTVTVSPTFEVDGVAYAVVLDGHHSLAAAVADGAEPAVIVADCRTHDAVTLIEEGRVEDFLLVVHTGESDYGDAITGELVW